ncbi:MAG: hypothetical protein IJN42_03400 [Clostridia bacterium]|nr:hypothetical protein [Clostridia bacterium]
MKKTMILFAMVLCLTLAGCQRGDVSEVQMDVGTSEIYTAEEIEDAMAVVRRFFAREYDGCTLKKLWYEEEHSREQAKNWAKQYGAKEGIVLLSEYTTGPKGGDGSLNPNDTYGGWNWVLVRNGKNKPWKLKTWGY